MCLISWSLLAGNWNNNCQGNAIYRKGTLQEDPLSQQCRQNPVKDRKTPLWVLKLLADLHQERHEYVNTENDNKNNTVILYLKWSPGLTV